jgi:hypothetical protein
MRAEARTPMGSWAEEAAFEQNFGAQEEGKQAEDADQHAGRCKHGESVVLGFDLDWLAGAYATHGILLISACN